MSLILLLLTVAPPTCTPDITGTTWNNGKTTWQCNGSTWVSYTADAGGVPVLQAGPFSVSCTNCSGGGGSSSALTVDGGRLGAIDWIDGGWINATVTNVVQTAPGNALGQPYDTGTGVSGTRTLRTQLAQDAIVSATVDGGVLGAVTWIDGGQINATVSNFPAMWPQLQWVGVDSGTVDARVTSLPAVVLDGGVNVSSLPAVVIDGGINISSLPAVVIDGGVSVSNFPAQWVVTDGGYVVAQGVDSSGNTHPLLTDTSGAQYIVFPRPLPLPKCNPVRRYNCQ